MNVPECKCHHEYDRSGKIHIIKCPFCKAAPAMYEALKSIVEMLRREAPGTKLNGPDFIGLGMAANKALQAAGGWQ